MDSNKKPAIKVLKDGPFIVKNLTTLRNSKGVFIETKDSMALCRCGDSEKKPFCDNAHLKNGFSGKKEGGKYSDRNITYEGRKIDIHDNRVVCSHIGHCILRLPEVFRKGRKPWADPDADKPEKIAEVIRTCPSGALSYSIDGVLYKDYPHDPEIFMVKNGPYNVIGGIRLDDPDDSEPETTDHYALCRCGASRNKPFCDGTHRKTGFKDRIN